MNHTIRLYALLHRLRCGDDGQDLVEYALLVSMIALAAIASMGPIANALTTMFTNISSSL